MPSLSDIFNSGKTGLSYDLPASVLQAIHQATTDSNARQMMVQLIGSESGGRNINSPTGARGIGQFTGAALRKNLYRNVDILPRNAQKIVRDNIAPVNVAPKDKDPIYEYQIKSGGNANAVNALAHRPDVAVPMVREHVYGALDSGERLFRGALQERLGWLNNPNNINRPTPADGKAWAAHQARVEALEYHLNRPMTVMDAKTFYMCGYRGGAELLVAAADPKTHDHRAGDYTTDGVRRANKAVFYHEDGRARSVTEYVAYMAERVGMAPVSPGSTMPAHPQMQGFEEPQHISKNKSPAPEPRPALAKTEQHTPPEPEQPEQAESKLDTMRENGRTIVISLPGFNEGHGLKYDPADPDIPGPDTSEICSF